LLREPPKAGQNKNIGVLEKFWKRPGTPKEKGTPNSPLGRNNPRVFVPVGGPPPDGPKEHPGFVANVFPPFFFFFEVSAELRFFFPFFFPPGFFWKWGRGPRPTQQKKMGWISAHAWVVFARIWHPREIRPWPWPWVGRDLYGNPRAGGKKPRVRRVPLFTQSVSGVNRTGGGGSPPSLFSLWNPSAPIAICLPRLG